MFLEMLGEQLWAQGASYPTKREFFYSGLSQIAESAFKADR
jgi:hypothetical protein